MAIFSHAFYILDHINDIIGIYLINSTLYFGKHVSLLTRICGKAKHDGVCWVDRNSGRICRRLWTKIYHFIFNIFRETLYM